MTSCMILSCARENCAAPIRFAGIISVYSKKAIPQLTKRAMRKGLSFRFFKCPYQANSIKRLEQHRSVTTRTVSGIVFKKLRIADMVQSSFPRSVYIFRFKAASFFRICSFSFFDTLFFNASSQYLRAFSLSFSAR